MSNGETPCTDFLVWQEAHTAAEGMVQLGLSRTTYFRRLKQMRAKVEEAERVNAECDRSPSGRAEAGLSCVRGTRGRG
jgi:hypothetical protein